MSKFETAESIFNKANGAFVDEDFSAALELYNSAIQLEGDNAEFYIKRSACHYKLKNFTDAISDANNAIKLNPILLQAYLRKGMAAFALEEFESAKASFEKGLEFDPVNSILKTWSRKCDAELEEAGEEPQPSKSAISTNVPSATSAPTTTAPPQNTSIPTPAAPAKRTVADYKPEPKIRHEWFQTEHNVSVGVLTKNLKQEDTHIDIKPDSLLVTIKLPEGSEYQLDLDLCGTVIPEQSSYKFLPARLDITLKKDKACRWANLERVEGITNITPWDSVVLPKGPATTVLTKPISALNTPTSNANTTKTAATTAPVVPKPSVPLVTTPNPIPPKPKKNWDAIIKEAEAEEKPEGEEALQKVFQSIYANGSDEQRRAMMKSFIESGGTVLSTNWDEVGKNKVEGSAPKGMEMKDWKEKDQK
jgi:suppressor of G2 allele of SKP1